MTPKLSLRKNTLPFFSRLTVFSGLTERRRKRARTTLTNSARQQGLQLETLEARLFLAGVVISEFQASNNSTIADEDGDFSDWIELYNSSLDPVDITGWHLTDDASRLSKWTLGDLFSDPNSNLARANLLM